MNDGKHGRVGIGTSFLKTGEKIVAMVTHRTLWFKMAVAQSRRVVSDTFGGLVAPSQSLPVPNHLLDTKIFSKVSQNDFLQTKPSVVQFAGFNVGEKLVQVLNIVNASSETQRMHIIPPSTKYFYIKYTKNERLVPGLSIEVTIEFKPDEWRYYYDCIRIHSKAEENLLIPIHAYPVMNSLKFPKEVHFASVPLGESKTKIIPLKCEVPLDFEFQFTCLQSSTAFIVNPMSGVVPGHSEVLVHITYTPTDFSTSVLKLQLLISQFNSEPQVCTFTGTSQPGQVKKLKEKEWGGDITTFPHSKILDPLLIDPLGRTRIKKLKTRPWLPEDKKAKEVMKDGYRIPADGINNTFAVAAILNQQQGKLKAKDIRQAVQSKKDVGGSSKQMKETMFEYQVHQNIQEERQNQLRWCVNLGEDPITDSRKTQILESRNKMDTEYKVLRGVPVIMNEFDRSSTGCQFRRIHRQADDVPNHQPKFDVLVNEEWSKRHMVIKKFVQAGRKVIIRTRATKNVHSLTEFLSGWRKGKFCRDQTRRQVAESEEEKLFIELPKCICASWVQPFSFAAYKSPDTKDDLDVDALGALTIQPTVVNIKTHIPYYNLKVPKHYSLLGYNPHSVAAASSGYVTSKLVRNLRIGAQDEVVSLSSNIPVSSTTSQSPGFGDEEEELHVDDVGRGFTSSSLKSGATDMMPDETVMTEPEVAPLVVPAALFQPLPYHPMHIFNPAPGLQVFKAQLPYSEVDEDYHLCPLPRHRQPTRGSSGKPGRRYLERQDVIPSVMTWKRFPCHPLVSVTNHPTLSTVWLPRWSDPFSEDLLPTGVPQLLNDLPDDDIPHDEEIDEEDDVLNEILVPTPLMVHAQFPTAENILAEQQSQHPHSQLSDMILSVNTPKQQQGLSVSSSNVLSSSRDQREKELNDFIKQRQNRLGARISQRVTSMHDLLSSSDLVLK